MNGGRAMTVSRQYSVFAGMLLIGQLRSVFDQNRSTTERPLLVFVTTIEIWRE
jgi:hypothetical protein